MLDEQQINYTLSEKIAVLAFVAMCKKARTNSVLFNSPLYKQAQKVGLSDGRIFKKYIQMAVDLGLVTVTEVGYHFIKWDKAVKKTLGLKDRQAYLFDKPYKVSKFQDFKIEIEKRCFGLNLNSQQYIINSRNSDKSTIPQNQGKPGVNAWLASNLLKLAKNKKEAGSATYNPKSVLKFKNKKGVKKNYKKKKGLDDVVSGVNHMAKLIGKSPTTAMKRFKSFAEQGLIACTPIVKHAVCTRIDETKSKGALKTMETYAPYSKENFEAMNEDKKNGGLILPTPYGYKSVIGKRVDFFKMGLYVYNLSKPLKSVEYHSKPNAAYSVE